MTYQDRKTNIWDRKKAKVAYVINKSEHESGPGQGTSTAANLSYPDSVRW